MDSPEIAIVNNEQRIFESNNNYSLNKASQYYDTSKFVEKPCLNLERSVKIKTRRCFKNAQKKKFYKSLIFKHLPVLEWLPKYSIKSYLVSDMLSGFTVGIMNIPQGMAYSLLASLNPVNGLYISFFPLIMYTFFGTSRHLAIGSFRFIEMIIFYSFKYLLTKGAIAIVSLLSGDVFDRMLKEHKLTPINGTSSNSSDYEFKVSVACSLSLLVGLCQVLMGFIGLGFVSAYFSDSFVSAYTCGSAIHVGTSQIKDIFGLKNVKKYQGMFKIPKVCHLFQVIIKIFYN